MSRVRLLALALTILLSVGCREELSVQISVRALDSTCDLTGVEARLSLPQQGRVCQLTPNAAGDGYEGTCGGLEAGADQTVILEYLVQIKGTEVMLARAQRQVTIDADKPETSFSFDPADLKYAFDDDTDGIKNIDELCLGRDPLKADPPTFTGSVVAEPNAIGQPAGQHVIGERIKIVGSEFPPAEWVKATFGPLLDGGSVDVTPVSVTSSEIELQIPPGLDVSQDVSLTVTALGTPWSTTLKVARIWAEVVGSMGTTVDLRLANGSYPGDLKLDPEPVCLNPSAGDCGEICGGWLHHVSADGRYLLLVCIVNEKTGTQPVQVVELPTGTRWAMGPQVPAYAVPRLVVGGAYMALGQVDQISFHSFDTVNRKLGSASPTLAIPGLTGMAVDDGKREELYAFVRDGGKEQVLRYQLALDAGGALTATPDGTLDVPVSCATGADPLTCAGEWADTIAVMGPGQVVLTRPKLNQVDFVDFGSNKVTSAPLQAPRAVAVPPRTRDQAFVATMDTATGGKGVGVCRFSAFGVTAATECSYVPNSATATAVLVDMKVVPEETQALVTFQDMQLTAGTWIKVLQLATMKFNEVYIIKNPLTVAVQP